MFDERFRPEIHAALLTAALTAEGRMDGFRFALRYRGDIERIEEEIRDYEEIGQSWHALPEENPMQPGSGPRLHRDAYVAALREAKQIILHWTGQES
jgi:hypothetical protein